ncbi:hypothetical protein KPH14_006517 [Odynerus spinipes]|uniref:RRM domain-containing protein n=1 Tax=Odynerus spinipes TaxID=1348599 RepID=A0AAD9RQI7_9HYME|nr:hypothetical protein KPH14_006517 [Odynerus spinipes]
METGFLNFHDEEHFSDFSLSLDEHNLMEKPQDLLMHIVENDFEYMETHLDVTNSDSLWGNEEEDDGTMVDLPVSDVSSVVHKMDNIKEDFAKVLTDWQEHIGYLQASDMEEYMDIIGLSMTASDKKSFCPENLTSYTIGNEIMEEKPNIQAIEHISNNIKQEIIDKVDIKTEITDYESDHLKNKIDKNSKMQSDLKLHNKKPVTNNNDTTPAQIKMTRKIQKNAENINTKQKKRKKNAKGQISVQIKQEAETEDCVDVETVSDEVPVLEAGDVKSLLEQFEASENSAMKTLCRDKISTESNQKKSATRSSDLHKNIRDSLPKEVIDRIKASGRKRVISVIPAIPSTQGGIRSNGTRMQDAAATLSRNKLLKIVTNNTNTRTVDGGLVQLDHDYCSNSSSAVSSSDSNSEYERQSSDSERNPSRDNKSRQFDYHATVTKRTTVTQSQNPTKSAEYRVDRNFKKDSGLESGEISDNSEETSSCNSNHVNEVKKQINNQVKVYSKDTQLQEQDAKHFSNSLLPENVPKVQSAPSNKPTPVYEMKIRSALATSILQLRKDALNNMKSIQPGKQMVSVLKKPPNTAQPVLTTNPNESIVTTTNSSNDEVQNIIIQNTQEEPLKEETKKPPRRKLNLAEYRSRREQNKSDSSRTNSPIQPMTLVYVHHASTTTEPIKDNPENLAWCEREIISVLKPKADLDEEKMRPKPTTKEIGIQTYETVFEFPTKSLVDIDERNEEQRSKRIRDRKQRPYRKRRLTSSSSRSRSRSKSRSRSYIQLVQAPVGHPVLVQTQGPLPDLDHGTHAHVQDRRDQDRDQDPGLPLATPAVQGLPLARISEGINGRVVEERRGANAGEVMIGTDDALRRVIAAAGTGGDHHQILIEDHTITDEGITKADLRRRFEVFGPVVDISVHFREHGDNYGFVTFAYKNDAYEAVEHGNDDPALPRYDLCFGGRRAFCKVKYADLDGLASNSLNGGSLSQSNEDNTFDLLLKEAKAKLRKRKV